MKVSNPTGSPIVFCSMELGREFESKAAILPAVNLHLTLPLGLRLGLPLSLDVNVSPNMSMRVDVDLNVGTAVNMDRRL